MNGRTSTGLIVAMLSLLSGCGVEPSSREVPRDAAERLIPQPGANVLVVSFDALRADALGSYGYSRPTSPNLDRFARDAVVFERAYSAAPVTPTSFAAMFTSLPPVQAFRGWQLADVPTMAESFSAAGYTTAAMVNNVQLTEERGFDRGFQHFETFVAPDLRFFRSVDAWLEAHHGERFFAWVHFISPHSPYDWREESIHLYDPKYEGTFATSSGRRFSPESQADIARLRELYDGEIHFVDRLFGRLLERLEGYGLLDETVIAVTADHGDEFGERGRFQHWSLHDETIRVPLMIRTPGLESGGRSARPASTLDLWPTLAALAEVPGPPLSAGRDLRHDSGERNILSVAMTDKEYRGVAVTRGGWRLIHECMPERTLRLYDLNADPGEIRDLSAGEPDRTRRLVAELRGAFGSDPCRAVHLAIRGKDPAEDLAPETVEGLKALGYLQ